MQRDRHSITMLMNANYGLETVLGVEDPETNVTHNPGCEGLTVQWRKKVHKQSLIAGVMQGVMWGSWRVITAHVTELSMYSVPGAW